MTHFNLRQAVGILSVVCLALAPAAAHAQAFQIAFTPAAQTIFPGQTETFSGTITNISTNDLYINLDAYDPLGPGFMIDDTPFYNTFGGTPVLLGAGKTYAATDLFTVTDTTAPAGIFPGQYTVYGGLDPTATDQAGSQTFTLLSPVPEASTSVSFAVLLVGGMVVLAIKRRKQGLA